VRDWVLVAIHKMKEKAKDIRPDRDYRRQGRYCE
jgi:hypothetical protein